MRFSFALRNTFRNGHRTALSVLMIAGGVSGVVLFKGFAHRILSDLREITIQSQTGHLQLAKVQYWLKTQKRPQDVLLDDYEKLSAKILKIPGVRYAAGHIAFFGLISTGDDTSSARGISLDPKAERKKLEWFRFSSGKALDGKDPFEVIVGSGLAERLRLKPGASVTVLAYTYDGVINALDLRVTGVFHTQISDVDDTTFILPLVAVQRLLDTQKVEQIVVGLDRTDKTQSVLAKVRGILGAMKGTTIVAKTWSELSEYYHQCVSFFRTQNLVIEIIILSLVLLGVLNTIGMSIFERTGEIGTLRALGETRGALILQFLLEGGLLGLSGGTTGAVVATLLASLVNAVHVPLVVPGANVPLVIHIDLLASSYVEAVILAALAATAAALIPAYRASRLDPVEALRHYL